MQMSENNRYPKDAFNVGPTRSSAVYSPFLRQHLCQPTVDTRSFSIFLFHPALGTHTELPYYPIVVPTHGICWFAERAHVQLGKQPPRVQYPTPNQASLPKPSASEAASIG